MALAEVARPTRTEQVEDLFPLPCVPFERMMLADDRPDYPMIFVFELALRGELDRDMFLEALEFAVRRNPLLQAHVERPNARDPYWLPSERFPPVDWGEIGAPLENGYGERIDLAREAGLKMWVRTGEGDTRLIVQFHHACCDGVGALQFFADLFAAYHNAQTDENLPLRELDAARLRTRGQFGLTPVPLAQQLRDTLVGVKDGYRFFRNGPTPLANGNATLTAAPPGGRTAFVERVVEGPELVNLRKSAAAQSATLNDLLMRDLFLALYEWNRDNGLWSPERNLRVMMPCNLRLDEDAAMPAANVVSYAFLTRRMAECQSPASLLAGVREETELIRRHRLALYFIGGAAITMSLPFGMQWMLRPTKCFATAYASNISDPTRVFEPQLPRRRGRVVIGNLELEDITVIPPVRPNTHVAVTIMTYANRLKLGLKFDPHHYRNEDTARFADQYLLQLTGNPSC